MRKERIRSLVVLALVWAGGPAPAAEHRTANFVVRAASADVARRVGETAERYRKKLALQWLGKEMPKWGHPCPLRVTITTNGSGGSTSFAFDKGAIWSQEMHIEGTLERLLSSVLPHEVTHTVFAYHFRQPVPRWADEGGSVLSEDELERSRHNRLARKILKTQGRAIPLRRLLILREYPNDVMALYAQGYSVTDFLVARSSRPAFLNFVADGMGGEWDKAVKKHYGFASIDELEKAWLVHLRRTGEEEGRSLLSSRRRSRKPLACVLAERPPAFLPR